MITRRLADPWSDLVGRDAPAEYHSDDFVCHRPPYPDVKGHNEYWAWGDGFRAAFPDVEYVIDRMVAEGDTVVAQVTYQGTHTGPMGPDYPPSDRHVAGVGCIEWRWENDKVVEEWDYWDELGFWQQMGS